MRQARQRVATILHVSLKYVRSAEASYWIRQPCQRVGMSITVVAIIEKPIADNFEPI